MGTDNTPAYRAGLSNLSRIGTTFVNRPIARTAYEQYLGRISIIASLRDFGVFIRVTTHLHPNAVDKENFTVFRDIFQWLGGTKYVSAGGT